MAPRMISKPSTLRSSRRLRLEGLPFLSRGEEQSFDKLRTDGCESKPL